MTKSELVYQLNQTFPEMSLRQVEKVIDSIFGEIVTALGKGYRVELRGFGAFSVRYRDRRMGRNPRTGEKVKVEGKFVPFFKAGKDLRDRMNTLRGK
ncbi:integration host factor subunit beta [Kamptonema cortianum]|jgi:integration host factor subunit beta|nr:integration host factor subunit beta [Geitlerinema splendidum]MDK3155657.1 integration host factor subunit beta [Kamptonema cortianum]